MNRMRTPTVIALSAVGSWLVGMGAIGGESMLGLTAEPGPHQLFAISAIAIGMAIVSVGTAVSFSIILAAGGKRTAIRRTAVVLAAFLLLVMAAPALFGYATMDAGDAMAQAALLALIVFLSLIAFPALTIILIQWWAVTRHLDASQSQCLDRASRLIGNALGGRTRPLHTPISGAVGPQTEGRTDVAE